MTYFLNVYGFKLLALLIVAAAGWAGFGCKQIYREYCDNQEKRQIAADAVLFVEQVFRDIHGYQKLSKAMETARALLNKKGILFDAEEMRILIEAACGEFNSAFEKPELDGEGKKTPETGEDSEDKQEYYG